MKIFGLMGSTALAIILTCGAAIAADVAAPTQNWTGLHIGIGAGYGMDDHALSLDVPGIPLTASLDGLAGEGVLGTIEAGYDVQLNDQYVVGIQADYTRTGINTSLDFAGSSIYNISPVSNASLMLRAGQVVDGSTLVYVTGGWTHSWFESNLNIGAPTSMNAETNGITFGGGVESAISDNLTAKIEYRYSHFGDISLIDGGGLFDLSSQPDVQTVRAVLSYHGGDVHSYQGGFDQGSWTGLHVGLAGGVGLVNHELSVVGFPASLSGIGGRGILGSAEVGFDYQLGERFLVGLQGDYTRSGMATSFNLAFGGGSIDYSLAATDSFSVLGRMGLLASPNVLWYGEGGWTHTTFDGNLAVTGSPPLAYQYGADGLTLGAGVEAKINDHLSWKTDYRYTSYNTVDFLSGLGIAGLLNSDTNVQTIRTAISYRF